MQYMLPIINAQCRLLDQTSKAASYMCAHTHICRTYWQSYTHNTGDWISLQRQFRICIHIHIYALRVDNRIHTIQVIGAEFRGSFVYVYTFTYMPYMLTIAHNTGDWSRIQRQFRNTRTRICGSCLQLYTHRWLDQSTGAISYMYTRSHIRGTCWQSYTHNTSDWIRVRCSASSWVAHVYEYVLTITLNNYRTLEYSGANSSHICISYLSRHDIRM